MQSPGSGASERRDYAMTRESQNPTSTVADRLLSPHQAAELLGVSVRTMYRLVTTGDLPKVKLRKSARFRLSDVQALIQRGAE